MSFPGFPAPPSTGNPGSPGGHNLLSSTHSDTIASTPTKGDMIISPTGSTWDVLSAGLDGQILQTVSGVPTWSDAQFGSGNVQGPSSSTDNAIVLFDGTSGNLVKDSLVTIDSSGNIYTPGTIFNNGVVVNTVASGTTSVYTLDDNYYHAILSGVSTVNLPSSPQIGQQHVIKDIDGVASTNNIIIDGNGNTIDGQSQVLLTNNYESITLIFGPREWNLI